MKRRITVCVLVVLALAAPAKAQDFVLWNEATIRNAGLVIPIYDPVADDYRYITLETLLGDVVALPDNLTRYIAIADGDAARPVFTAADMLAGSSGVGRSTGIPIPDFGSFNAIWIVVAAPESAGALTFIGQGGVNTGLNSISAFEQQADATIGGATYDVWVTVDEWFTEFLAGFHIYFTDDATNP